MPYILKPNELYARDSENGQFRPQNVIASQTADEQIALVEAAGASTIAAVQEAISDSQAAIDTIISVAGQGTDTGLTQSGAAADAKVVGDTLGDLESAVNNSKSIFNIADAMTIPYSSVAAAIDPATGGNGTVGARSGYVSFDKPICVDFPDAEFLYCVWVYTTNSTNAASYSPTDKKYMSGKTIIYPVAGVNPCFRIGLHRTSGELITETVAEEEFSKFNVYTMTDTSLSKKGFPSDSKAVGDKISVITGGIVNATKLANCYINADGEIVSSSATSLYYFPCIAGHTYGIYKDFSGANACSIGEISSVPAIGSLFSNYKYSGDNNVLLTIEATENDYIAFNIGGYHDFTYSVIDFTDNGIVKLLGEDISKSVKEYGTIVTHSNHSDLGFNDVTDFPDNSIVTLGASVTDSDITNLPIYGDTINVIKLTGSDNYYTLIVKCLYNYNKVFIGGHHYNSLRPWVEVGDSKQPYISNPIYFSVSVNQSNAAQGSTADSIVTETSFSNVRCVLKLPSTYTPNGKPTPLIMHCHGTGQYVANSSYSGMDALDYMVSAGYAIFDVNGSQSYADQTGTKGQTVGSPRTLEAYYKAYLYILERYNVEPGLYVACKSAGGLTAINFANKYPEAVKVLGLCYPVTDLYNQAWLHPWDRNVKAKIAEEYFFDDSTGETYEESKVVGFNPIISNGTDTDLFISKPVKIWHGTGDTVVNYQGSVDFINKVKHAGGYGIIRLMNGHGHSMGSGENIYNVECTAWFNRFRQTTSY